VLINVQLLFVLLLFVSNFSVTIEQHFHNETVQRVKQQLSNEKRLIKDLVDNYQVKWGRPVNNMSEKVVVFFGINLVQLLDLDEKNQILVTNVYALYEWNDTGLRWDKEDYGGIETVRIPVNFIWTPDIVLYNYADTRLEEKREALAIVKYDGTVKWRPPSIFKSTCQIDMVKFPYDVQKCSMKFGSWTYDGDAIDIQFYENRSEMSREEYIPSNEWDVMEATALRNVKFYSCCKEPYPDVTFYLKIKRRGGFYNYILVLPCLLLSYLTLVIFWLPPESPAKLVLGMSIFSSFFVLLLLLSKNVPSATDKIPQIGAFYCLNMIMVASSTFACTVVVHIFFRGNGRVPKFIRKIFLEFLATIFWMKIPPSLPQQSAAAAAAAAIEASSTNTGKKNELNSITTCAQAGSNVPTNGNLVHFVSRNSNGGSFRQSATLQTSINNEAKGITKSCTVLTHEQLNPIHQEHGHLNPKTLSNELNMSFSLIENDIKEIRDYLRHTRKKLDNTDSKSKQTNEWKQVALVIDRAFFFAYLIFIFVSGIVMLPR